MSLRALATSAISFGLVSVPIKVFTATSSNAVSFNMITAAGNRVKQVLRDASSGEEVSRDECLKGYEHIKGQFVTFTKDEIKNLDNDSSSKVMEIQEFVDVNSIDPLQVEKTYFLGPDKGGDKPYALLAQAMTTTGKVAVAQWTNRGRNHLVIIRPFKGGLILQQCFYSDEIRDFTDVPVAKVDLHPAEEEMAVKFLNSMSSGPFDATKYSDQYTAKVRAAVDAKIQGRQEVVMPTDAPKASVMDLLAALKASLEQTGKEAA